MRKDLEKANTEAGRFKKEADKAKTEAGKFKKEAEKAKKDTRKKAFGRIDAASKPRTVSVTEVSLTEMVSQLDTWITFV